MRLDDTRLDCIIDRYTLFVGGTFTCESPSNVFDSSNGSTDIHETLAIFWSY